MLETGESLSRKKARAIANFIRGLLGINELYVDVPRMLENMTREFPDFNYEIVEDEELPESVYGTFIPNYEKHGQREMGLSSDQYRSRAISFANKVDRQNHLSFVNDVGLTVKFSKKTNEFAMITEEGNVATYFKTSLKEYERVKRYYGK